MVRNSGFKEAIGGTWICSLNISNLQCVEVNIWIGATVRDFKSCALTYAFVFLTASAVEGLFTVPVSEEAASKAWASVFAKDPGMCQLFPNQSKSFWHL